MRDEMAQEQARNLAAKQAEEMAYRNKTSANCDQATPSMSECNRMSARSAIEQRCEMLLREANGLRALLRALPQDISPVAEEALWRLIVERR